MTWITTTITIIARPTPCLGRAAGVEGLGRAGEGEGQIQKGRFPVLSHVVAMPGKQLMDSHP